MSGVIPGTPDPPPPPPRRVAVTAPRRNRSGGWSARAAAADLHAQPRLGQIYVRALVRNQLRLALGVLAVLAAVLGGLPAAFALLPGLRTAEVAGIRLPWLLLGVVAYPVMVGAAWFHVRHAERVEDDFTDLFPAPPAAASVTQPAAGVPGSAAGAGGRIPGDPGGDRRVPGGRGRPGANRQVDAAGPPGRTARPGLSGDLDPAGPPGPIGPPGPADRPGPPDRTQRPGPRRPPRGRG